MTEDGELGGFRAPDQYSNDAKFSFEITHDDPGDELRFEFEANVDQTSDDESFVLDNVYVSGTDTD
jgi:hypothetical protein